MKRIEAVLKLLGGEGERLAVDANGRFDLDTGLAYGRALKGLGLRWYEEPFDPLDYLPHAMLAADYPGVLATGENLFSMQDARNLIRYGGLRPDRDILQFDPALSYGLVEYLRTLDMLQRARLEPAPLRAARRPPVRAQHRGRPRARRQRELPGRVRPVRRLRRRDAGRERPHPHARRSRHRLRGQGRAVGGDAAAGRVGRSPRHTTYGWRTIS